MKRIYGIFIGLMTWGSVWAQTTPVQLGIKGGLNIANYNAEANTTDSRLGFHLGGLAHIHLTQNWAVQPEVVYSSQGAEFSTTKHKLSYINLPILVQYMTRGGFRLETGPQLGLLTDADREDNAGRNVDIKNAIKNTDFSWAFGAGYLLPSGLGIDARYNLGISDIRSGNGVWKNRVWQLGVFYQFGR